VKLQTTAQRSFAVSSSVMSSEEGTVSFNVGCRIYQTTRFCLSRIPETLLAQSSEGWREGDKPIFIDRDADRFRYCLDFMRNGCRISLPHTESMDDFLDNLKHYGFEDINPKSTKREFPITGAAEF